jgi:hypothetical protein
LQSVEELGKAIVEEVKAASSSSARMLRKQFIDTYKAIVTRKFMFQMESRRTNSSLSVCRLSACPAVEELQVLSQGQLTNPYANWFAPATASQVSSLLVLNNHFVDAILPLKGTCSYRSCTQCTALLVCS